MDIQSYIIGLLIIALLAFFIVRQLSRSGLRSPAAGVTPRSCLLLTGISNAGKTALFHQLRDGEFCPTVMSMKENMEAVELAEGEKVSIIDFPGHRRLRSQVADFYPVSKAILFLVDASDKETLRESAEYLFDIFTFPALQEREDLRMLVGCNKSDIVSAVPVDVVKEALEKELTQLKATRGSLETEGDEEDSENAVPLGRAGQPFNFAIDSPFEVSFAKCSVKDKDFNHVLDFIQDM